MLQPGIIPDKEPLIRVGIILPEDRYTSLTIEIPEKPAYQLQFSGRTISLDGNENIYFRYHRNETEITINDEKYIAPNEIQVVPVFPIKEVEPAQGIKVKNVISGRDFHWKKYIDVTFSGTIIIRPEEDRLIVINELPIEHYLMCVATSEMGSACPPALIEAQTIAARSWMLANVEQKHVALTMDVCNDDCCQRYQGSTYLTEQSVQGALNTYGQVLMFDDKICDARYSKSCGGVMETFESIWKGAPLAYMQNIADAAEEPAEWQKPLSDEINVEAWLNSIPNTFCSPHTIPENELKKYLGSVDEEGKYFRWDLDVSQDELIDNLKRFHQIKATQINAIAVKSRGGSGRANKVEVDYNSESKQNLILILQDEFAIRQTLYSKFLYSSAFIVHKDEKDNFHFKGGGWGHGAGLCQIGALGMSLKNYNSEEIVLHYYPGSALKRIY